MNNFSDFPHHLPQGKPMEVGLCMGFRAGEAGDGDAWPGNKGKGSQRSPDRWLFFSPYCPGGWAAGSNCSAAPFMQ